MTNEAFAAVLKQKRVKAGLSQEELAERANLHRTYISQLEREKKSPTLQTVSQLSKALGVDPLKFIKHVIEKSDDV